MRKRNKLFLVLFVSLLFVLVPRVRVYAVEAMVVDSTTFKNALEAPEIDKITVSPAVVSPIVINERITVTSDKEINLNGKEVHATVDSSFSRSGGIDLAENNSLKRFVVKDGKFVGGPRVGLGSYTNEAGLIYAEPEALIDVIFENVSHDGGAFFKGRAADVLFRGNIHLQNEFFNVRALNVTMYGNPDDSTDPQNVDFYGYVDSNGAANPNATGSKGGNNITFDGYKEHSAAEMGKKTKNLNIPKNSKVKLVNNAVESAYLNYKNTIGNFAQINVDGSLIAEGQGSSLRTTAAYYRNEVGTESDMSEINVSPGAIFKISTVNRANTYGVIYTYNLDINVESPKIFDIRNFGSETFFHSWNNRPNSNLRINNSDIGVWDKEAKGVGNPSGLYQNVAFLRLEDFIYNDRADVLKSKTTSSNPVLADNFNINEFSRISNDVALPLVTSENNKIGNNQTSLSGSTDYRMPDGTYTGKKAPNADITLNALAGSFSRTTKTDNEGNWVFNNLDLSDFPGGTVLYLTIVDNDERVNTGQDTLAIIVEDKIAPKANPKLVKTLIGDYSFISQAANAVSGLTDETSSNGDIQKNFVDTVEQLKAKADKLGVYSLPVKLTDESSNERIIDSKLLVSDRPNATGLVVGQDFDISYTQWMGMSESERRSAIVTNGGVRGWTVSSTNVNEVTDDPSKMVISYDNSDWKPFDIVDITIKVGDYTKVIKATLKENELMTRVSFEDSEGSIIETEQQKMMKPGETYTIESEEIPGYKVESVQIDGENAELNADDSVTFVMKNSAVSVKFIYKSVHYTVSLESNRLSASPRDTVNYQVGIKSGMIYGTGVEAADYNQLGIIIPISDKISSIDNIQLKNSSGDTVGIGQFDTNSRELRASLSEAVKDTEDLSLSYTATISESAQTDDLILMKANVKASYNVNGTTKIIERESDSVTVKVAGSLSLVSSPTTIDFGAVTYQAKDQTVDNPILSEPLIVSDTRSNNQDGWVLYAVVAEPLTSNGEELEGDIIYRKGGSDLDLSSSQIIYSQSTSQSGDVNVTDSWGDTPQSEGIKLKFKSTDLMKSGAYTGKIRWNLMPGQP